MRSFLTIISLAVICGVTGSASAQNYDPFNPVVTGHGPVHAGTSYNPWTGHTTFKTHSHDVHASTFDPNRQYIAPGSYRQVNEVFRGADGHLYRRQGAQWNSAVTGKEHGQITTTRLSNPVHWNGYPQGGTVSIQPSHTNTYSNQLGSSNRPSFSGPTFGGPSFGGPSFGTSSHQHSHTVTRSLGRR